MANPLLYVGGAAVGYAVARRGRGRRAKGLCFPFALEMARDRSLTNEEFFDKSKFRVVHGEVWAAPLDRYVVHAWVEKDGRAFDWQTREVKPEGFTIKQYYKTYKPRNMVTYSAEEATINCLSGSQKAGPWEPHERRKGRGPRPRRGRGRRAASDPKVSAGKLQFYRGGKGTLPSGVAYFTSADWMAKFYGPVKEYRLYLRNPKFVTDREWGGFDSVSLRFDPSPIENLRAQGYDSAVWIKDTAKGRMYTVVALSGTQATKKPKGGSSSIQAAFQAALEAENYYDDAEQLRLLRRVAKRLNLDVKGLTVYQPDRGDRFRELYNDWGKRVWYGRADNAVEAKSEYIEGLIRQKLGES